MFRTWSPSHIIAPTTPSGVFKSPGMLDTTRKSLPSPSANFLLSGKTTGMSASATEVISARMRGNERFHGLFLCPPHQLREPQGPAEYRMNGG